MATKDDKTARQAAQKRLAEHPRRQSIEAHKEAQQLRAHEDADDVVVPAVTADVDETPAFVKYGAAVLLGLAFGVGCYVWVDGGVPSAPQNPGRQLRLPKAEGAGYYAFGNKSAIPAPFEEYMSPDLSYSATEAEAADASGRALASAKASAAATGTEVVAVASSSSPVVYLFEYGSSKVPETAALSRLAEQARDKGLSLDVKAYTDEHGKPAFNRRLSERRARAIADYLVAHGVPAGKVTAKGMGPTHAYANDAQDRRAEIVAK
ncbi:MAG: OmpA family protein [Muribaculaceae bacterium]|nr:OmpA family protein [Muribaculaceae bacterium]